MRFPDPGRAEGFQEFRDMQEARLKVGGQDFEFLFRRLKQFYSPLRHVFGISN